MFLAIVTPSSLVHPRTSERALYYRFFPAQATLPNQQPPSQLASQTILRMQPKPQHRSTPRTNAGRKMHHPFEDDKASPPTQKHTINIPANPRAKSASAMTHLPTTPQTSPQSKTTPQNVSSPSPRHPKTRSASHAYIPLPQPSAPSNPPSAPASNSSPSTASKATAALPVPPHPAHPAHAVGLAVYYVQSISWVRMRSTTKTHVSRLLV
jgi:hypothetical protein